jgi:hypothetical protein
VNRPRIIAAFLLSPVAGALYLVALIMFDKGLWTQLFKNSLWSQLEDSLGIVSMVLFFAVVGYVAEGVLGIPLLFLFRRTHRLTLPWFLLGGLVIGIVVSIVVSICLGVPHPLRFGVFYCVAPAIISTTAFWFIAGRQITKPRS